MQKSIDLVSLIFRALGGLILCGYGLYGLGFSLSVIDLTALFRDLNALTLCLQIVCLISGSLILIHEVKTVLHRSKNDP